MTENKKIEEFNKDFQETRMPLIDSKLNKLSDITLELITQTIRQELKQITNLNNEQIKTKRKIELWILIWKISQGSGKDNEEIKMLIDEIDKIVDKSTAWKIRATMDVFNFNNKIEPEEWYKSKPFYKDRNNNILFHKKKWINPVILDNPDDIKIAVQILNEWYISSQDKTPLSHNEIEKQIEAKRNIIAQETHRKNFEKNN